LLGTWSAMMSLPLRVTATLLPVLVLLSELCVSHADFLKGLGQLDPEKIAKTVTKGDPSDIGKQVFNAGSSIAKVGKENGEQAVGAVVEAGKVAATIAGNGLQEPQPDQATLANSTQAAAGASGDHRSGLEKGMHDLLGATPEIEKAIVKTAPAVQNVLKDPKEVKHIESVVEKLTPKVVTAIKNADPDSVIRAEKVLDQAADPKTVDTVLRTIDRAEWWGAHWKWMLIVIAGAGLSSVACCQLKGSGQGSPSLLVDAEINQWMNAGSAQQSSQIELTEDACFRQF